MMAKISIENLDEGYIVTYSRIWAPNSESRYAEKDIKAVLFRVLTWLNISVETSNKILESLDETEDSDQD